MAQPQPGPSVYPTLQYDDAWAALAFLTDALALRREVVHASGDGDVAHAELSWAEGMVMLARRPSNDSPIRVGRTQVYLVVDDVDAHCARARAAGAEVVAEPTDMPYGARECTIADPEGNLWCFGTYRSAPRAR